MVFFILSTLFSKINFLIDRIALFIANNKQYTFLKEEYKKTTTATTTKKPKTGI